MSEVKSALEGPSLGRLRSIITSTPLYQAVSVTRFAGQRHFALNQSRYITTKSMMTEPQVALVTGGASGIGLALTRHLLHRGFKVIVGDLNEQKGAQLQRELGTRCLFVKTDVKEWDAQAEMFKRAIEWAGKIDFFAANAGIANIEPIYDELVKDAGTGKLQKPNLATVEIDLLAVFYGLTLFKYYHERRAGNTEASVVVTASQSGLYPLHFRPTYSAAKHGVIGLVRSAGQRLQTVNRIRLNAICPGPIPTGIDGDMLKHIPKENLTPIELLMRGFDKCIDEDITGAVIEVSNRNIYVRDPVDYCDECARFLSQDLVKNAVFHE